MTKRLRLFLPLLVILAAAVAMAMIVKAKPAVERVEQEVQPPLVRVVEATRGSVALNVYSNGTVEPTTRSTLGSQIGARVANLTSSFAEGAFFERGDLLVRLDPSDFELAVTQAEARVAQAEVQLEREEAETRMAIEEWSELGEGEPTSLVLREPQLAQARAELKSAQAALEQAKLQLERTRIRAPFSGRVESKLVDVGQFVGPGTPLAQVYSTERAEISLKVPQSELAFLDITLGRPDGPQPRALLSGRIGSTDGSWPARVARTGSRIDPQTRMVSVIAEIEDPFSLTGIHAAPLPIGLYLDAEIEGKTAEDAIVLPRAALREEDRILVVDSENRLRIREVEILRVTSEELVITRGLDSGERVCVSPLTAVVDGMRVRVQSPDEPMETPALEGVKS
ncbi:MAG: efflux RND transporter periplasmic adaptor subunit [bacterium]|nr:efflux RND transporter periplasmic adaptor subunit [bacterium]